MQWRLRTLVGDAWTGGGRHGCRAAAIGFEPDVSRILARTNGDYWVIACVSDPGSDWRSAAFGAVKKSPRRRGEPAQLTATAARQRVTHHPAEAVSGSENALLIDA